MRRRREGTALTQTSHLKIIHLTLYEPGISLLPSFLKYSNFNPSMLIFFPVPLAETETNQVPLDIIYRNKWLNLGIFLPPTIYFG